jgi:cytoskeletal protein RodZ
LLVAAGWLGAVVLAVLVGLAAINVIGSGLTSSGGAPKSEAEVQRDLAALPPSAEPPPSQIPSPSPASSASASLGGRPTTAAPATTAPGTAAPTTAAPSTAGTSRTFGTRGGTVVATCSAAGATITGMAPEAGFAVHERTSGAQAEAEGEFRSTSDNHDRVKFSVTCSGGRPTLSPRSGGGDD